jgi:hypothetical protein
MITGAQIRAARVAVRWTAVDLGASAGLAARTILRLEASEGVPSTTTQTITKIQKALEDAGIEFIGSPDDAPGIRIHSKR